jgi:alpha-amylase
MTDICLIFEVHQPFRLNSKFISNLIVPKKITKNNLYELYFDHKINKEIFDRVSEKCYVPANKILMEQVKKFKRKKRKFKFSFSISGVFIEQCEKWNQTLLDSFKQLASSQCIEFLGQTYYHSLSSLFDPNWTEFVEQVEMHRKLMKEIFGFNLKTFENTECLYNDNIAKKVETLGYKTIITEGAQQILGKGSPNFLFKAKNASIRVLLRNYKLSDDIGFRFGSTQWNQWPLTADKYGKWLSLIDEPLITIFLDYETFGEHYWSESGILNFLKYLPVEVDKLKNLRWITPAEIVKRHHPIGEIEVKSNRTISWADAERNTSAWLGNPPQNVSFNLLQDLEPTIRELNDPTLFRIFRYLQNSDHFHYMFYKEGDSGIVHDTFRPCGSAIEYFITYITILSDFQARCQILLKKPNFRYKRILRRLYPEKGFQFFKKFVSSTGLTALSLEDFHKKIKKININSILFHWKRGDFERWINIIIGDKKLASQISKLSKNKIKGEKLRRTLLKIIGTRIKELKRLSEKNLP